MKLFIFSLCILSVSIASASPDTVGSNGIDSAGLTGFDQQPLTGAGVNIGQVEQNRPGKITTSGGPDDAAYSVTTTIPTAVFQQGGSASPNMNIDDHAEGVAGNMISTDANTIGVAPQASLYSSAYVTGGNGTGAYENALLSLQQVASQSGMRAINSSWGKPLRMGDSLDGNSLLTLGFDWVASRYDVLNIIAGNEDTGGKPVPTDDFNGMVIGASSQSGNVFSEVATFNYYGEEPFDRTSVDLIAPGTNIAMLGQGNNPIPSTDDSGTSFATPLVTGTVALLQQYGGQRNGTPNWSDDYVHHQVMKAVLMNSADKVHLQSDLPTMIAGLPSLIVPPGGFLDQDRTVLRTDNGNWFSDTAAADKTPDTGGLKPIDDQFGAGELDAKRALTQFSAGEYHSFDSGGPMSVPVIGWDYGHSVHQGDVNSYFFNQQLEKGAFVSITLAFDRTVNFATGGPTMYHSGDTFQPSTNVQFPGIDMFSNLDLYLVDTDTGITEAESVDPLSTIDHIFWQIQNNDHYEFEVQQSNENDGAVNYAVAWWTLGTGPLVSGYADMNQDGHVDAKDIVAMEKALANEAGFAQNEGLTMDQLALIGDVNGDGVFNNADLQALLNLLKSGGGSTSVPEPASFMLLAFGGLLLIRRSRR
jgi:hypothetical protein